MDPFRLSECVQIVFGFVVVIPVRFLFSPVLRLRLVVSCGSKRFTSFFVCSWLSTGCF